jgi:hypothetical protein
MGEYQVAYIMRQLRRMDDEGLVSLEVKHEVMERYNDRLQEDLAKMQVWQGDCSNYYRTESGRIVTQYPHNSATYRAVTARPDPEAFDSGHGLAYIAR